jgi:hypothetical protein
LPYTHGEETAAVASGLRLNSFCRPPDGRIAVPVQHTLLENGNQLGEVDGWLAGRWV